MDIQYPLAENGGKLVQVPSSDIDQTSSESPPPSPKTTFSQHEDEPDNHARFSDWGPANFDLDGNTEPVPGDLDPSNSEHDLGDEESVPSASIEFHPLINGMYSIMLF